MRNWRKLDQGGEVWGVWAGGAIFSGPVRERLKEVRGEADTGGKSFREKQQHEPGSWGRNAEGQHSWGGE